MTSLLQCVMGKMLIFMHNYTSTKCIYFCTLSLYIVTVIAHIMDCTVYKAQQQHFDKNKSKFTYCETS